MPQHDFHAAWPGHAEEIDTARLIGEPLSVSDFEVLCSMHHDPKVMASIGGIRANASTQDWLDNNLRHWITHGFGIWMFWDRSGGQFVGRAGLRHVEVDGVDAIELAYALRSEYWGSGLATEMAQAVTATRSQLGIGAVVALIDPSNRASQRVAEKCGFHFDRQTVWKAEPTMVYLLKA